MKGVPFNAVAGYGGINKIAIEERIVTHQNGAGAAFFLHGAPHSTKDAFDGLHFMHGTAKWVIGVNAGKIQRRLLNVGALKGSHMVVYLLAGFQIAVFIHVQDDGGNFQQSVGLVIETAGFHIDHHGEVATKALGEARGMVSHGVLSYAFGEMLTYRGGHHKCFTPLG